MCVALYLHTALFSIGYRYYCVPIPRLFLLVFVSLQCSFPYSYAPTTPPPPPDLSVSLCRSNLSFNLCICELGISLCLFWLLVSGNNKNLAPPTVITLNKMTIDHSEPQQTTAISISNTIPYYFSSNWIIHPLHSLTFLSHTPLSLSIYLMKCNIEQRTFNSSHVKCL